MRIRINKAFAPLYTSKKRYFLVTGSRGSLKSSSIHDYISRLTYEEGHGVLFTRWTLVSAENSIIPEFRETLERNGFIDDFEITRRKIVNKKTGSFILFMGIKSGSGTNTARLKSIPGITTLVIEECEDFVDEKQFDIIDDSIRTTKRQNRVILVMNPTTKQHWIYKRFIQPFPSIRKIKGFDVPISQHPQVEHIHTTYHIAEALGYLSDDWLHKAKLSYQKAIKAAKNATEGERYGLLHTCNYFSNYIGGWLLFAKGAIITNWAYGEFDDSLPESFGADWGMTDPTSVVKIAIDFNQRILYVKLLIYGPGITDIVGSFHAANIPMKGFIVADSNEKRTNEQLVLAGFSNLIPAKKWQGSVVDGLRLLKQFKIVVDPDSPEIATSFQNYKWADKKQNVPAHDFSHIPDSIRYPFIVQSLMAGLVSR